MLRVKVELVPGGIGTPVELAHVNIAKMPAPYSTDRVADYQVVVFGKNHQHLKKRNALVRGHRRQSEPVLALVRKALEEAGY